MTDEKRIHFNVHPVRPDCHSILITMQQLQLAGEKTPKIQHMFNIRRIQIK
jgi:hypothetical protein